LVYPSRFRYDKYKRRKNRFDFYRFSDFIIDSEKWSPVKDEWANLRYESPIVLEEFSYNNEFSITTNICLKDIGFSKMVDPYQMFQNISMYLSGPLSPYEDPDLNPEPDGATKMEMKGMDPVRGFRRN
jgi:hypothetical protein